MMMFKRIDHVEIVTDQLDRTVQFYTEVLGFTVKARDRIERSGLGVPIDLVYLDLGGTVVELISYEGGTVDPAPQTEHLGYRMMALEVDDMQMPRAVCPGPPHTAHRRLRCVPRTTKKSPARARLPANNSNR